MAWTAGTRWPGRRGISSRIAIRVGGQLQGADKNQPEGSETSETSRGNASLVSVLTARLVSFLTARWAYTRWCGGGRCTCPTFTRPGPFSSADLLTLEDGLLGAAGFGDLKTRPPDHVCFAEGVHTRFGLPKLLRAG